MKLKGIVGLLLALVLGYGIAAPYLTINEMRAAARERNSAALAAHIDLPSVRQSFKDQFNAAIDDQLQPRSKDNPFAALGAALGAALASGLVERLIDFMVTPDGIRQLMSGVQPSLESSSEPGKEQPPFDHISRRYESLNRFSATVNTTDGKSIDFVLHRQGLAWKLAEVRLPLTADAT